MTIEDDDLAPCDGEGTATVSFPAKLRCMLEEAEVMGLENIISWEMNGTAFRVHKSDDFVEVIMGRWFNQTKYKSFQRQLNLYGFTRITRGLQKGSYFHELFQKDRPELGSRITRKKVSDGADADAELAPTWLADASAILEPTPIHESSSGPPWANPTMMNAFETYFQTNVAPPKVEGKLGGLSSGPSNQTGDPGTALERILDTIIESKETQTQQTPQLNLIPIVMENDNAKNAARSSVFPDKLHDMLDYCEGHNMTHIASWQMQGRAFKVHSINLFMKELMPRFFKLTKFESLQRQLNLYSFTRVSRGANKGCYHHPLFVKGGRSLSEGMQRRRPEDLLPTPTCIPTTKRDMGEPDDNSIAKRQRLMAEAGFMPFPVGSTMTPGIGTHAHPGLMGQVGSMPPENSAACNMVPFLSQMTSSLIPPPCDNNNLNNPFFSMPNGVQSTNNCQGPIF